MITLATDYIMHECTMKPLRRFGVDSELMSVLSPRGNHIGHYNPLEGKFTPVHNWQLTFSNSLIDSCGLRNYYGA